MGGSPSCSLPAEQMRGNDEPTRRHQSALNKGSLTLPSPAVSLLRPSSLALVRPWCSLSGPVGSLPAGLRPLVVAVSFVVAVSVRCARVTHPPRPLVAALGTQPLRRLDEVRRCASFSCSVRSSWCVLVCLRVAGRIGLRPLLLELRPP